MKVRLKCESPEVIEYTIVATMTCKEWEEVRESLDAAKVPLWHPTGKFIDAISDVLGQARKIYWADVPEKQT